MSSDLLKNAIAFLQRRYPKATVLNEEVTFRYGNTEDVVFTAWPMIAQDPSTGVKQRAVAVNDLGLKDNPLALAQEANAMFDRLDKGLFVGFGNAMAPRGHAINTMQMTFAPKVILYTDTVHVPYQSIFNVFEHARILVEIISEGELFNSLFVSFGGTDIHAATTINSYLKTKGVTTWFFPEDALPGQKLHRMMHDGVNKHDRVLLICSKESLTRHGVLNEIERVLEREAKEGGSEILIPITLDNFVYEDWAPARLDVAAQVRSRVITKVDISDPPTDEMFSQLNKLVKALSKQRNG